jgi:hypothetical protein
MQQKIEVIEKNNSIRKIQKVWKNKISKFYSFIASILHAKQVQLKN